MVNSRTAQPVWPDAYKHTHTDSHETCQLAQDGQAGQEIRPQCTVSTTTANHNSIMHVLMVSYWFAHTHTMYHVLPPASTYMLVQHVYR